MKKVAIACQGGGSHTAFSAGVLSSLLTDPQYGKKFTVIALSGTSGGAVCAGIVWPRLLHRKAGPALPLKDYQRMGQAAAKALEGFWLDLACESIVPSMDNQLMFPWQTPFLRRGPFDGMDTLNNAWALWLSHFWPFAETECKLLSQLTRRRMEELFARHVPLSLFAGKDPQHQMPRLRIGAANICEGWTEPIKVEEHPGTEYHKVLLASASIPPLFQPTQLNGNWYWDGVYAHNPPVECLANPLDMKGKDHPDPKEVPDEIWVIQINPQKSAYPPRTAAQVVDRRNEFIGNMSLLSELYHIDAINWLVHKKKLTGYKEITLRVVSLDMDLDFASKYSRSRRQIESLFARGQTKASGFFEDGSIWTMWGKQAKPVQGLHNAVFSGARHRKFPKMPSFGATSECTAVCPSLPLCKACPQIGPWQQGLLDIGQRWFEGRVVQPQVDIG